MAPQPGSPAILRFGVFEVELRAGELRKQGVRIKLQEQPFHVLTVLLQRPGEVVTREELRSQNWPADTFVDFDNSLNTAINKLREALGDSADNPRFIETLPRRGYRFIAPVTDLDGTTRGTATGVRAATPTRNRKIVVTVAVVMLAVGIAGGLIWRARQTRRLTEKDTIVLADFTNSTGDPVFDDTLKQGLRVQLEQSPFLNILSEQKVSQTLSLMGRSPEQRLTPELARDLCQRVGSKATLTGTISSLGTHYVIGLNAVNCETGDTLASEQVEADSREHVLRSLGESATKMRKKLGESLASIQKYDAPMEWTTTSLEALKAFSLGVAVWRVKGDRAALPFFQRAVEMDPNFAMAYGRVGTIYNELGESTLSAENTRRAYKLRDKVSARERLYVESHYHYFVTGELEKAAQVYEVWQQTYPRDGTPYSNLAALYAELGKYEKALEEAREELRLFPKVGDSYYNVGSMYLFLGRLDEAEAVFKQAEERKLESEPLLAYHYQLAFLKGDEGEMERMLETAAGKPGEEDLLLSEQSDTEAYYGHLAKARGFSRRAVESARHAGAQETAALWQANAALREAEFGNAALARQDSTAALALAPGRGIEALAALALARAGEVARAQKLANKLNKDFPLNTIFQGYWLPAIRAAIELNRKNPTGSIEILQATTSYELGAPEPLIVGTMYQAYLRGEAYLLAHQGKEAAAEFQKFLDHRGVVLNFPLGALAHLGLARAYVLQGDKAKARAAYQDFLTLWKDADPDIPILKEAKAEYAKLL
jgi:DNA-binding winged helix-turn-helix (wHTH) protein/Tfp pilus assembly protein PilF